LFELGLFLGKLGPKRVFAVLQEGENKRKKVKIPSDLLGINLPRFTGGKSHTLIASVNTAAINIRPIIETESRRHGRMTLVSSWGYEAKTMTFFMGLSAKKLAQNRKELNDRALVVVARKENNAIDLEHDRKIAISKPRKLSRFSNGDVTLSVDGSNVLKDVKKGDVVWGYLLLIPGDYTIGRARNIAEMLSEGAELLEGKSHRASF
jgi:hypothetical protein